MGAKLHKYFLLYHIFRYIYFIGFRAFTLWYSVFTWRLVFFYRLLPFSCQLIFLKKRINHKAIMWGLSGGIALFSVAALAAYLSSHLPTIYLDPSFEVGVETPASLRMLLQQDKSILYWHLLFSAFITAILEEFFYRGCLQNYLTPIIGTLQAICLTALVFALVHPKAGVFMIVPAIILGILFWKQGLSASIMAHTSYNGLILIATAWGY